MATERLMGFDIPEQQLFVYFDDPGHGWHHRVLLLPLGAGRWIATSTDYDVEVMDLAEYTVCPLARNTPFEAIAPPGSRWTCRPWIGLAWRHGR